MTIENDRRLFSRASERTQIFAAGAGRCAWCGKELEAGWHADHKHPYSKGGPTELWNGQPLCPECSRKKAAGVSPPEPLRSFQRELVDVVLARIQDGQLATVGWIETGSGKTRAWQNLAHELARGGEIDYVAVYAPRLNLCEQADIDWQEFDTSIGGAALRRIGHAINRDPLRPRDMGGFVSTYQAAVTNPLRHLSQARNDRGRFLLVLDEAQTCGYGEEGGGTKAGELMRELAHLARHTLVITGTPYRADREQVVLCKYTDPDEKRVRHLIAHVRATYSEGVAHGYLRPFEFELHDGHGKRRARGEIQNFTISEEDEHLRETLSHEDVWAPLVDKSMEILRERQQIDSRYRGLLACIDTAQAADVLQYLRDRHPDLPAAKAVHKEGVAASKTLRAFRESDRHLVLVTVRMAFIGYDCKPITVVGVLTNYRADGHLRQLCGRGLRMWDKRPVEEQHCYVVAPDDPQMAAFAKRMREETELGLRDRGPKGPKPPPGEEGEVIEAEMDEPRAYGWFGEIDDPVEARKIEEARKSSGIRESATRLMAFMRDYKKAPTEAESTPGAPRRTRPEEVKRLEKRNTDVAKQIAGRRLRNGEGNFEEAIRQIYVEAHEIDGLGFRKNDDLNTPSDLETRYVTLCAIRDR